MTRSPQLLCLVLVLAAPAFAQDRVYTFSGCVGELLGNSMRVVGDLDGDGVEDIGFGAYDFATGSPRVGRVIVVSGRTRKRIRVFQGDGRNDWFGINVAAAGDVDNDGRDDLIVGAPGFYNAGKKGYARVFSGRDGTVLHTFPGKSSLDYYGWDVAGVGDRDGDGHDDLLIGAPATLVSPFGRRVGYAEIRSGKTGAILHGIRGRSNGDAFGFSVAPIRDLDGDTKPDYVIGAFGSDLRATNGGRAVVYSSKTDKVLFQFEGLTASLFYGSHVASCGDVDKDGTDDIFVCGSGPSDKQMRGVADVFSGRTGRRIHRILEAANQKVYFGRVGGHAGDFDKDGHADIAVGGTRLGGQKGSLFVYSGRDASLLREFKSDVGGDGFGWFGGAADFDRDGSVELICGAGLDAVNGPRTGAVILLTPRARKLSTLRNEMSRSAQGSQALRLEMSAAHAGKPYMILGTLAGTRPGLRLGSLVLPLNPDGYFFFTVGNPNSLIAGSLGVLGASGDAAASVNLPPRLPLPAGMELHHAALVFGRGFQGFDAVSEAVPLLIKL